MEKANKKTRCFWACNISEKYHDEEWGVPSYNDDYLFEMLVLESFQAGLSWVIILKKREAFRKAFNNFNYKKIAKYDEEKVQELVINKDIVRSRGKIVATIQNAKAFMEIQKEFGSFSNYIWSFTNNEIIKAPNLIKEAKTPLSNEISKDLKKRGFKYVGSITIFAYLQAIGVYNCHEKKCYLY